MATTAPPSRARVRRPVAVLVAVFVALGAVGTATGAALGAVGGGPDGPRIGHHHDDDGPRLPLPGR